MTEPRRRRIDPLLLANAWCTLLAVRIGLALRGRRDLRSGPTARSLSPAPDMLARRAAAHVRLAARFIPGARCLAQALALRSLLTRDGYESALHVGVGQPHADGTFTAHAWVTCSGVPVIGDDVADFAAYTPLFERS